MADINNLRIN